VTSGKGIRTRDVGGSAGTAEVTAAIIDNLLV
jgi:tartrate dehydrogenase/decarboxylase/D-malate dehydrogenase